MLFAFTTLVDVAHGHLGGLNLDSAANFQLFADLGQ